MSQYLTADINPSWQIHFQHYKIEEIGCFLACTDGCFQYVSAPWEFEKLLLDTLSQSTGNKINDNNWQKLICQKYTEIKQDDVSLILYPVGFNGINHLRNAYQQRWHYLQENFTSPTDNTRYDDLQSLWVKYRIDYERYLPSIQDIQQTTNYNPPVSEVHSSIPDTSKTPSSSKNQFQELNQSYKNKAAVKAEEIQSLLQQANSCYQNNQLKTAQNLCAKVLEIDPERSESKYILGLIYTKAALSETDLSEKINYFRQAALYLEESKNYQEKLLELLQTLGFIYYNLDEWDRAVDCYQEFFKKPGAERVDDWETHLEAFVTSLKLIGNRYEPADVAIQFCQRLIPSILPYGKDAYPYYFMAILQEIKGELNPAWNSIQRALNIYAQSNYKVVNYEMVKKARQKFQEILNKLNYRGY